MRKRKKTATPGCTTPGESAHTSCRGGDCALRPPKHLAPQTPNGATTLTAHPAPCSHPGLAVAALQGPLSLPSGLVAMPRIPLQEREHQRPGALCPAPGRGRGCLSRAPKGDERPSQPRGPSMVWQQPPALQIPSPSQHHPEAPGTPRFPAEHPALPGHQHAPKPGSSSVTTPTPTRDTFPGPHPRNRVSPLSETPSQNTQHIPPTPPALPSPPPTPRGFPAAHLEVAALVVRVRGAEDRHVPGVQVAFVHQPDPEALHGLLLQPLELQQQRFLRAGHGGPRHTGLPGLWGRSGRSGARGGGGGGTGAARGTPGDVVLGGAWSPMPRPYGRRRPIRARGGAGGGRGGAAGAASAPVPPSEPSDRRPLPGRNRGPGAAPGQAAGATRV